MQRLLKFSALLCVLLFSFSLYGCAANDKSQTQIKEEAKASEVAKQSEQTKVTNAQTNKAETTASASTENTQKMIEKTKEPTKTKLQDTKKVVTNSSVSQAKTITSTKKSTAVAVTKPVTPTAPTITPKPSTPTPSTPPPIQKPAEVVTISIVGPKELIDNRTIIGATKVSFKDGDTIFSVLLQVANEHNIVVDSRGSGATAYIEGIDNYYEFDYGAKSGWVFKLNGVSLTKSIGIIKVKDGDRIECYYTE